MEQEVMLLSLTATEVPRCHVKTCWLHKKITPPVFFKVKWKCVLLGCFGGSQQWLSPVRRFYCAILSSTTVKRSPTLEICSVWICLSHAWCLHIAPCGNQWQDWRFIHDEPSCKACKSHYKMTHLILWVMSDNKRFYICGFVWIVWMLLYGKALAQLS